MSEHAAEPVSSRQNGTSDDALLAATGKVWADWFTLLDAANATTLTHPQIVEWLCAEHDVPPWWSQMVTAGYEQARGMRQPGQRADGSFEVGASATLPLEQQAALDVVIAAVSASLGAAPTRVSRDVAFPTARWSVDGPGQIQAMANPTTAGKTSVSLTTSRLTEAAEVAPAKAAMKGWLADALRASQTASSLS